jgi:hypothetical protein
VDSFQLDDAQTSLITLPWMAPSFAAVKGIVHSPSAAAPAPKPEAREALLGAIAKARRWIDDLRQGRRVSDAVVSQPLALRIRSQRCVDQS